MNKNRKVFDILTKKTEDALYQEKLQSAALYAKFTANYAWMNHPGIFFSQQLEQTMLKVGTSRVLSSGNNEGKDYSLSDNNKIKVLHVASELYDTGGHTRVLLRWIENTQHLYNNIVVITRGRTIPPFVSQELSKLGISPIFIQNKSSNVLDSASFLRKISTTWPDYIVLHVHPDDILPLLAYSSFDGPPILFFNHADHVFWLGSSISNIVINIRNSGFELSATRRNTQNNVLMPIPLTNYDSTKVVNAKEKLGLTGKKVMTTMASDYKFAPWDQYNFSSFFESFLEKRNDMFLIAVGASLNGNLRMLYKRYPEKVLLIPATPHVNNILSATDLYIDSFPLSSLTSRLDITMKGIPSVSVINKYIPTFNSDDPAFVNFPETFAPINELEDKIEYLLNNDKARIELGQKMRDSVIKLHCGSNWLDTLNNSFKIAEKSSRENNSSDFSNDTQQYDANLANFFASSKSSAPIHYRIYNDILKFSYRYLNTSIASKVEKIATYVQNRENLKI